MEDTTRATRRGSASSAGSSLTISGITGDAKNDGPKLQGKLTSNQRTFATKLFGCSSYEGISEIASGFVGLEEKKKKSALDAVTVFAVYGDGRGFVGLNDLTADNPGAVKITVILSCFIGASDVYEGTNLKQILGESLYHERPSELTFGPALNGITEESDGVTPDLVQRYKKGAEVFSSELLAFARPPSEGIDSIDDRSVTRAIPCLLDIFSLAIVKALTEAPRVIPEAKLIPLAPPVAAVADEEGYGSTTDQALRKIRKAGNGNELSSRLLDDGSYEEEDSCCSRCTIM